MRTNNAIAAMNTMSNMISTPLGLKVRVECHDNSQDQQILCWGQANNPWRHLTATEEAAPRPARIVNTMLQPHDRGGPAIWDAIFERCRVCLNGLGDAGHAAVAVPINLRAHCCAPVLGEDPVYGQLRARPKVAGRREGCTFF